MFDMHYDLLTILYFNYKKNNPLGNPQKFIEDCKRIYHNDNIIGGIVNLYFQSQHEMKADLGIDENELKDVKKMFKTSTELFNELQAAGIIPNGEFIFGIEGCDYLKDEKDLKHLYNMGLRSILPVWNNQNKFGSGIRGDIGLTDAGISLVREAIDLNMIVDVSHANIKTFYGILYTCYRSRLNGKSVNLIASHSNVRSLCDRERNLNDGQLHALNDNDGYIGLFTNGNFLSKDNTKLSSEERVENYLKHLDYILNVIEFNPDRILTSTDNMDFMPDPSYVGLGVCPHENISKVLYDAISSRYNEELANKILVENAKKLIRKVR